MGGGFQSQVNTQPAPAVAGDFADANPRASVDAGPGGLVAGPNGLTIGLFAWAWYSGIDTDNAPTQVSNAAPPAGGLSANPASGAPTGFVHREQQGLNTTFLSDAAMTMPKGFACTLMSMGSFWVVNNGTTSALPGQTAYANLSNGQVSFASQAASVTASIAAATQAQFTGTINGNILTVSVVAQGTLVPGATVGGTVGGTGVVVGTQIVSQLSGTIGGVGTYALNVPEQNLGPGALVANYGILTVSATISGGPLAVGNLLSGAGVGPGVQITGNGTGAGGTGTYFTNNPTVVGSTTIGATSTVATKFVAMSAGQPGELVKISSHLLG